jgi:hypothetical protein
MLGLPIFSYMKKANLVFFWSKSSKVKLSWGYGSSIVFMYSGLNIFVLPLISYLCFELPLTSVILLYILCATFGFSLAIETKFENIYNKVNHDLEKDLRKYFDNALSRYLPSIILICIIFLPIDYYSDKNDFGTTTKPIILFSLLIAIYFIQNFLRKKVFTFIDLKKSMPLYSQYCIIFFPIFSICFFQSWDFFIRTNKTINITSNSELFYFLFSTGILPIRILYIYEPEVHILNRIITIISLIIYVYFSFFSV